MTLNLNPGDHFIFMCPHMLEGYKSGKARPYRHLASILRGKPF